MCDQRFFHTHFLTAICRYRDTRGEAAQQRSRAARACISDHQRGRAPAEIFGIFWSVRRRALLHLFYILDSNSSRSCF